MATYSVADPVTFVSGIAVEGSYTVPSNRFAIVTIYARKTTGDFRAAEVAGQPVLPVPGGTGSAASISGVYVGSGQQITFPLSNFTGSVTGCLFKNSTAS